MKKLFCGPLFVVPLLLIVSALLTSCVTKQYGKVQELSRIEEAQYTCREIDIEFGKLVQFERHIKETGQFDTKTIIAAFVDLGIGNSMAKKDARESVRLRKEDLEELAIAKGCDKYATKPTGDTQTTTIDKSQEGFTNGAGQPEENLNKAEILFWEDVRESDDPEMLKLYLEQYPEGIFSSLATHELKKLESDE